MAKATSPHCKFFRRIEESRFPTQGRVRVQPDAFSRGHMSWEHQGLAASSVCALLSASSPLPHFFHLALKADSSLCFSHSFLQLVV